MNKEFIPYNESLELKELGFDEPCFGYHLCKNSALGVYLEITTEWIDLLPYDSSSCKAPTFSQAFRWFREKLAIRSCIIDDHRTPGYTYTTGPDQYYYDTGSENGWFHTYEEAELACLKKLIEIAKQK